MTVIVDTMDQLSAGWFTDTLREAGVLDTDSSVSEVTVQAFGAGQFGLVARAQLRYDRVDGSAPESVIVKLPAAAETSRAFGVATGSYEAEIRFYQQLRPRIDTATPRPLAKEFESETGRFVLVLEDLSSDWEVGDSVNGSASLEQIDAAIEQLVALQAPLWDDPGLAQLDWLAAPRRTVTLFSYVRDAVPACLDRLGPRLSPAHVQLIETLAPRAHLYPERAWKAPFVVVHGDFRLDNMLFARKGDGLKAVLLDWQGVCLGPPLVDIGMFTSTSVSPEARRRIELPMLRGYHESLLRAGVNGFTFDECRESYRQAVLYTFLLSIAGSVLLNHTERGGEMFLAMLQNSAELVLDHDAATLLTSG